MNKDFYFKNFRKISGPSLCCWPLNMIFCFIYFEKKSSYHIQVETAICVQTKMSQSFYQTGHFSKIHHKIKCFIFKNICKKYILFGQYFSTSQISGNVFLLLCVIYVISNKPGEEPGYTDP